MGMRAFPVTFSTGGVGQAIYEISREPEVQHIKNTHNYPRVLKLHTIFPA